MEILNPSLNQTVLKKGTIVLDKNNNYFEVGNFVDGRFIMAHWHEGPIYEVAQEFIPLHFIDGIFIVNKDIPIKTIEIDNIKEENFKIIVTSNE
jgi:hypothetical protein